MLLLLLFISSLHSSSIRPSILQETRDTMLRSSELKKHTNQRFVSELDDGVTNKRHLNDDDNTILMKTVTPIINGGGGGDGGTTLDTKNNLFIVNLLLNMLTKIPLLPIMSITGMGIACLIGIFFMPRIFSQTILFPGFRLLFGTLYPAYASYKAVRTKNVKEYVSRNYIKLLIKFYCDLLID